MSENPNEEMDAAAKKIYPEMHHNPVDGFNYYESGKGMGGLKPHDLRRPPYEGNQLTGVDTIHTKDIPNFLRQQFESAANLGKLPEVFSFYVNELKRDAKEGEYGTAMDEKVLRALEKHISEIDKCVTYKDQQEALKPIIDYLDRIRMPK